jgi:hypothetical protein
MTGGLESKPDTSSGSDPQVLYFAQPWQGHRQGPTVTRPAYRKKPSRPPLPRPNTSCGVSAVSVLVFVIHHW